MNNFLASTCNGTDWSQFWPSMIATFFGFILALIGEYFLETKLESRKHNKDVKELFGRLVIELADVKKVLSKLNQYSLDKNPLKTPVWDEAINAGMVSLMEADARKQLFTVYKKINELNSWYEIKTNYYFNHFDDIDVTKRYNSELNNEIEKQKGLLVGTISFETKTPDNEKITIDMVIDGINTILNKQNKRRKKN